MRRCTSRPTPSKASTPVEERWGEWLGPTSFVLVEQKPENHLRWSYLRDNEWVTFPADAVGDHPEPQLLAYVFGKFEDNGLLGIRVELENPVFKPGVLYAIRHEAFFEAIDMPWLFRLPVVFAKAELMEIPGWGKAGARYGLISVEREAGARALRTMLTEARRLIAEGRPLIIFPEGTRIAPGETRKFKTGGAHLAVKAGAFAVPVAHNAGEFWPRNAFITSGATPRSGFSDSFSKMRTTILDKSVRSRRAGSLTTKPCNR